MDTLDSFTFKKMFRMDRITFDGILNSITSLIARNVTKAIAATGQPITSKTRLAVTLRWLAGGSFVDLCFVWGIARFTFFSDRGILWPTIFALDKVMPLGLQIDDRESLQDLSDFFVRLVIIQVALMT